MFLGNYLHEGNKSLMKFIFILIVSLLYGCSATVYDVNPRLENQERAIDKAKSNSYRRSKQKMLRAIEREEKFKISSEIMLGEYDLDKKRKKNNYKYPKKTEVKRTYKLRYIPKGYALYTYVIIPREIDLGSETNIEKKYKALLRTFSLLGIKKHHYRKRDKKLHSDLHLFVIPVKRSNGINIESYNFKMSNEIISKLSKLSEKYNKLSLKDKLNKREGPFFVTVATPILNNKSLYLTFLDMTDLPISAISQSVFDYKNKLEKSTRGNKPFNFEEKIKMKALLWLTKISSNIEIIALSYAN